MTAINSQEDFLRALSENPEWRDAVRAQILGEDLMLLPSRIDAFVEKMDGFIAEQQQTNADLKQISAELKAFVVEQKQINAELKAFNAEQRQTNADLKQISAELKAFVAEQKQINVEQKAFNADLKGFVEEQKQFNAEQKAFNADLKGFVADQKQFNAEQKGFVADQKQFNAEMKGFVADQKQFNAEMKGFVADQKQFNAEMKAFKEEQKEFNAELRAFVVDQKRFNARAENEFGRSRGHYAKETTVRNADSIILIMGLDYIRTVSTGELTRMALQAAQGQPLTGDLESFRNADLVVEASDEEISQYVAIEISYTADSRDSGRALRNARLLREFTGRPARAAVASVRNDDSVNRQITSGDIYWHRIQERYIEPE